MSEASIEISLSELGLDPDQIPETEEYPFVITPWSVLLRETFLARARAWVGQQFAADQTEQCANFVRRLLAEAGVFVPSARRPFDLHLTADLPQGPSFANSFFAAANGKLLGFGDLEAGDLLAFRDTYEGDFPKGCITHVGVYLGEERLVDRPTAGEPVRELLLDDWWKQRFVVGLRPWAFFSESSD